VAISPATSGLSGMVPPPVDCGEPSVDSTYGVYSIGTGPSAETPYADEVVALA